MSHPEFSRSNEQEPAPTAQLAALHRQMAKVMEEMPEGARIEVGGEGSVFWGWKSGVPIFNAQPQTATYIRGAFVQEYAPQAASRLRIGENDRVDLIFAPACYEADSPDEEAMSVSAYSGVTITRENDPVQADIYVIEMRPEVEARDEVQEATHNQQMHATLEGLEFEEARDAISRYDLGDRDTAVDDLTQRLHAKDIPTIGEQDCADLMEILEQFDTRYSE